MAYRYYSTQRPVAPGTFPRPEHAKVIRIKNFDTKTMVDEIGRKAWGFVEYSDPLTDKQISDYELTPEQ